MNIFRSRVTRSSVNPYFVKYSEYSRLQDDKDIKKRENGYIPSPLYLPHLQGKKILQKYRMTSIPSRYDLRKEGRLTSVKDQGPAGTCWAFAAYGSMESCLLPEQDWDFSENNMKNLLSSDCPGGYDRTFDGGGNEWIASAYLLRWSGPVSEGDDPYNPLQGNCKEFSAVKHLQKVVYIPDRRSSLDNSNLKLAIQNYGAVFSCMYFDASNYHPKNYTYYTASGEFPNHAVCLVGWDDNYSRHRFKETPPGDGAFIIRNSWGNDWGDNGYFYISYYDFWIGRSNAVFLKTENPARGDILHQYDSLGWVGSYGFDKATAWFANIFRADTAQSLYGCGFYTASPDSIYKIYVYSGVKPSQPRSGKLMKSFSGRIENPSYHFKRFTNVIPIKKDQYFSIVIKLTTPDFNWPVPAEVPVDGYSSKSQSQAGQGFISENGKSWHDMYAVEENASICLKAMARKK